MKVLFNGSMYSDKPTGVGIFVREISSKLIELGLLGKDSVIYTYSTEKIENDNGQVKQIRLPYLLEKIFGSSISLHRMIWNYFFLPRLAKNFDLVYSFSSHGSPFIQNQIITIHDLICIKYPSHHKLQYYYFRYFLPSIINSCRAIVTVSEYTKQEATEYYKIPKEKVKVISGAADHLQRMDSIEINADDQAIANGLNSKRFFLTVGASNKHKNLERLFAAMNLLENDVTLVVIGSGSNNYRNTLKEKYESEKIRFLSYISSELLAYLYKHCIANVYVSLYEGMGYPPYEAAIQNTVSIVSNVTALPEIYGNSVYYVDPLNIDDILKALTLFSSGKIDLAHYKQQFPALLGKYKWSYTAQRISTFIYNLN